MDSFDIMGIYLHTETDQDFIMVLEGPLSKLMMKVDPKLYSKYVKINSKGKSILYVKMHKDLYEFLRSAVLFYKKLSTTLKCIDWLSTHTIHVWLTGKSMGHI